MSLNRGKFAAAFVLLAMVVVVPAAQARVLNAEAILPTGQSGFVSLLGLTSGTGSPHLYDQETPFINFQRKPFGFDQPGTTEVPKAGVTIVRDAFGVPQITGTTDLDAWWGAGYAVAQDRLFEMEAFRHATKGKLAEVTGKGALDDDYVSRRDYYTQAERTKMFQALPTSLQQRFEAYRDGVNAWIAHVNIDPLDLPAEYIATSTTLDKWTVDDSIAIGIFLARTVPSGDGSELRNLRAIQESGSPKVMDKLMPLSIKGQLSTIPRSEGLFPQGPVLSAKQAAKDRKRSLAFAATLPKASEASARASASKAQLAAGRIGRVGGSSMFAVREPGNKAILFNGPELGFAVPELFVEFEVHAPGLDVRGVTAPGIPVIGLGHNADISWGVTSGLSDEDDLYAEKLVPGHPEQYYYKGKILNMDCRNEVFDYASPLSDTLLSQKVPEQGSVTKRFCRTIHGPVQSRQGNVAYARKYAIWGREIETLKALAAINVAKNIHDVDKATHQLTWNENLMAADSQGNIGYWHPGLMQIRPKGWDQRLPLPGTGEAEWRGLVPRAKMPHVINPKQGWLANWNNIPSQGWTSGDGESSERVTGQFHRVGLLMRLVAAMHKNPSFAAAKEVIHVAGSTAEQIPLAKPFLQKAAKGATGDAATVLNTILAWNGDYNTTDAAGTINAGAATWEAFKTAAAAQAVAPLGPGAAEFENNPGSSHQFDITDKEAYALRTLSPAGYRTAATTAFAAMVKRFGSGDPAHWREPRPLYDITAQGAEQAPPLPFFDRGTWEQFVELGP